MVGPSGPPGLERPTGAAPIRDRFADLNKLDPMVGGYQIIGNDIEIKVYKTDLHISLLPLSNRLDLLYYCIMGKLALEYQPTFIKIIIAPNCGRVYTLTKFIYNPQVRLQQTLPAFTSWLTAAIESVKLKYDVTLPAKLTFILAYPPGIVSYVVKYAIVYPIPHTIHLDEVVGGIREDIHLKDQLVSKLDAVTNKIEAADRHIGALDGLRNALLLKINNTLESTQVIDSLIASVGDRGVIKRCIARALLDAKADTKQVSLQDVVAHFLRALPHHIGDRALFVLYTKAAILLVR